MGPYAREIRDGYGALRTTAARRDHRRRRLPNGGLRSPRPQGHHQKESPPLHLHARLAFAICPLGRANAAARAPGIRTIFRIEIVPAAKLRELRCLPLATY